MANPTLDIAAPVQKGAMPRDDNGQAVTSYGMLSANTLTFTGNNATVVTPLFHVTGSISVLGIWGVVTTTLGANHTASAFRLNDQTAQVDITLSTGTDISAVKAGSMIVKKGLAATAITLLNNSAGRVSEPTTLETTYFSPFVFLKKTAATTDIEYVYATTDQPTSGAMQVFLQWLPLTADANVVPV